MQERLNLANLNNAVPLLRSIPSIVYQQKLLILEKQPATEPTFDCNYPSLKKKKAFFTVI
jgi:hypothetical protein